ncbi:hypothetical protein KS4_23060 [Poriferisphaera corsica]|uniref:Uncharacterized protein n=1 Tax=Poriferisphaera corsica TaxID=2528020 RepID=A0A517YVI4_9BACT|nr:hypothetical protein [Poriferisphaera corsica]QDU34241.1 hypothetical protein KS4_23060 [Poriferisphaera corsica]
MEKTLVSIAWLVGMFLGVGVYGQEGTVGIEGHAGHGMVEKEGGGEVIVKTRDGMRLIPDQLNDVVFTLTDGEGKPMDVGEFEVVHEQPVHVMLLDPNYSDYHHVHPEYLGDGKYGFKFTPESDCGYRMWVDVKPIDGGQRFIQEELASGLDCNVAIDEYVNHEVEVDGYTFKLKFDGPVVEGKEVMAEVDVSRDGGAMRELEPVMGAFAHMMGFYGDYETIAHTHPMGEEPKSIGERGGPMLKFHLQPEEAGYLRLYVQVRIDGEDVYAPFGVWVAPGLESASASG